MFEVDIIKMSPRATMHMSETNKKQGVSIKKKIHQKKKKNVRTENMQ